MRSHINEAKFTKRIPTDDYAFEEYSLSAAIDPSESGEDVLIEMRRQVSAAFAADLVASTEKKEEHKAAKKSAKKQEEKENEKSTKRKTRVADDEDEDGVGEGNSDEDPDSERESVEDDEAADDSAEDGDDSHSEDSEDGEDGEEEQAPQKGAKGKSSSSGKPASSKGEKTEGKKVFRKKPQSYNRNIEQHKEIFSGILRSLNPDWKKDAATRARAKEVSEMMEGEPFLDENGEALEDFISQVETNMAPPTKKRK